LILYEYSIYPIEFLICLIFADTPELDFPATTLFAFHFGFLLTLKSGFILFKKYVKLKVVPDLSALTATVIGLCGS